MKTSFRQLFACALLASVAMLTPHAWARPDASPSSSSRISRSVAPRGAVSKVGEKLASLTFFNKKKVNTRAKYYIYLCSASWCGPCNQEMPHVVEAYKEMKKSRRVELIFVGCDSKQEDSQAFLTKFDATFPAIMSTSSSELPGFVRPKSIPTAMIVDADGNLVKQGHGSLVTQWKQVIDEYENQQANSTPPTMDSGKMLTLTYDKTLTLADRDSFDDDEEEDAFGDDDDDRKKKKKKAKKAHGGVFHDAARTARWAYGKPSNKAKYFIIVKLNQTGYEGRDYNPRTRSVSRVKFKPYDSTLSRIKEYAAYHKAMRKDGRVDFILLTGDEDDKMVKSLVKEAKGRFAAALAHDDSILALPGVSELKEYGSIFVRASDGVVLKSSMSYSNNLVGQWKDLLREAEDNAPSDEE